ncbi:MAG: hypothetical protein ACT4QF_20970 [Sporichthyaceae bacterium]
MEFVGALAAAAVLSIGQASPVLVSSAQPWGEANRAVCALTLSAKFDPGLTLAAPNRAAYVAKGAIACVGLIAGTEGTVLAGEYRSEGVYRGDCLFGRGEETFTAVFVDGDGTRRTVVGAHRFENVTPLASATGDRSGALLHFLFTGGDCQRRSATSAVVVGELFVPQI